MVVQDQWHASSVDNILNQTALLELIRSCRRAAYDHLRSKEAPAGALRGAHKDGGGRGQTQRAGAGHHQHIARQLRR